MYILIGVLLGSMVTSTHDTREQCEGRKVILSEKGVTNLECRSTQLFSSSTYNSIAPLTVGPR